MESCSPSITGPCLDVGQACTPWRVHATAAKRWRDALCALRLLGMAPALCILLHQPCCQLHNADLAAASVLTQQLVTIPQKGVLRTISCFNSLLHITQQPGTRPNSGRHSY